MMMNDPDPFELARFVTAQNDSRVVVRALREVRAGRKVTHWMWFVFLQLAGLGTSSGTLELMSLHDGPAGNARDRD